MTWEDFLALAGDPMNWDEDKIVELLETGSVTMRVEGRDYIIVVAVQVPQ